MKTLCLQIFESEDDLEDGKEYTLIINKPETIFSTRYVKAVWCKHYSCFLSKYDDRIVGKFNEFKYVIESPESVFNNGLHYLNKSVLDYDPRQINAMDIKELHNICYEARDDNSDSMDVWEDLINWFEKKGLE